jgi:hypothetical protein
MHEKSRKHVCDVIASFLWKDMLSPSETMFNNNNNNNNNSNNSIDVVVSTIKMSDSNYASMDTNNALRQEAIQEDENDSLNEKDGSSDDDEDGDGESRGQKRAAGGRLVSDGDKKAERRAANRRSAFQSRQRRKILIEDLQRTVAALSKDNTDLRKTIDELRVQLEANMLENQHFRMQQQLSAGGGMSGNILGAPALQQAQASALLRAQQQGLFSAASAQAPNGNNKSKASNNDAYLQAQLAALTAHAQQQSRAQQQQHQQQQQNPGNSLAGLQGLLTASVNNNGGALGLQGLIDSAARAQAQVQQQGGGAQQQASANSANGFNEMLVGALNGNAQQVPAGQNNHQGQDTNTMNNGAVSEALRNFLQKQQSQQQQQ